MGGVYYKRPVFVSRDGTRCCNLIALGEVRLPDGRGVQGGEKGVHAINLSRGIQAMMQQN